MQSPSPLRQRIHRREVGDQQVEIDVQRLLQNLGPHHDPQLRATIPSMGIRPEAPHQPLLSIGSICGGELRMEKFQGVLREATTQLSVDFLGASHRIADDPDNAPLPLQRFQLEAEHTEFVADESHSRLAVPFRGRDPL
jgi:hypothetical protein